MSTEIYHANTHPKTKAFMAELRELFIKHQLAIVPTYEGGVSFHDDLRVVPLDTDTMTFVYNTTGWEDEDE